MTDWVTLLKETIAAFAAQALSVPLHTQQIDIPAEGYAARSAAPLAFHADAARWAQALQMQLPGPVVNNAPLISGVEHSGGHLLFTFTDAFYTAALQSILKEYPPVRQPRAAWHENAAAARILYTSRRMWMLSRKAQGEPACPAVADIQRALLLCLPITERQGQLKPRALELRMLCASDALLTMMHAVLPRQRQLLFPAAGHVGDAAARLFEWGNQLLGLEGGNL